ncbi:UBP1-associated protein 2A [Trifolium repens]|nr:UBP1-associated protein 2A [Trifolium repens]
MSMKQEMKDLKKRKIDEAGNSNLVSNEELRFLIESLDKPALVNLLYKLGSKDPSIAEEIETIADADQTRRKLFVRDLSFDTTAQSLRQAFGEYGEIEDGRVIFDKHTGISCRYGYIIYKHTKSAQNALRKRCKLIDGRLTLCMLAHDEVINKTSDTFGRKLFIRSLSRRVTSGMLHDYFAGHGYIEECSVVYYDNTDISCGYAFLTYKTVEAAKNAIKDLDQTTLEEKKIMVKYYADSNKGGVGQSSVPARVLAGYDAPPYPYPQSDAAYVAPSYPYPQIDASYVAPLYPYPQTNAPYAAPPYPSQYPSLQTHGYGQGPYPQHYYQNQ